MYWWIDVICIFIMVVCVGASYKTGLIKTVFKFVINILAVIAAWIFCAPLASIITSKINDMINSREIVQKYPNLGEFLLDKGAGLDFETLGEMWDLFSRFGGMSSDMPPQMQSDARMLFFGEVVKFLSGPISFLLIFIICTALLGFLCVTLDKIFKLPILNFSNRILGAVLGVFWGGIYIWIFCMVLSFFLSPQKELFVISQSMLENTLILKYYFKYNFISFVSGFLLS